MTQNNSIDKQTEDLIIDKVTGDPFINFKINSVDKFTLGPDDDDNDNLKLTTGASPSAGTELIEIEGDGTDANLNINQIIQSKNLPSNTVTRIVWNSDNTATNSGAEFKAVVGGDTSIGDPFIHFLITGSTEYSFGIDNSDNNNLKLTTSGTPSSASELIEIEADATDANINIRNILQAQNASAAVVDYTVSNTNNISATSHAALKALTGGTSGGDAFLNLTVSGATTYSLGIDNVSSDILTISTGTAPSTGTGLWKMRSTGERTMPLQPAVLVTLASDQGALAINTTHTIQLANEIFDQGSDFNTGTYTFTAPENGRYQLNFNISLKTVDVTTVFYDLYLATSNRVYTARINSAQFASDPDRITYNISVLADIDSADTVVTQVYVNNAGAAQTFIEGDISVYTLTNLSIALIC